MTAEEVLANAADRIECVGWIQVGGKCEGNLVEATCAVLAIDNQCMVIQEVRDQAIRALLKEIGGAMYRDIWRWNDEPNRTRDEVVVTIRNAKRWLS